MVGVFEDRTHPGLIRIKFPGVKADDGRQIAAILASNKPFRDPQGHKPKVGTRTKRDIPFPDPSC